MTPRSSSSSWTWRLGDTEHFRGLTDGAFLGDAQEVLQPVRIHVAGIGITSRPVERHSVGSQMTESAIRGVAHDRGGRPRRGRWPVDGLKVLSVNGVEEAAVAQTGLEDFGDDSYREGLAILLGSLREEARLNACGEAFIHQRIVAYLGQRLQVRTYSAWLIDNADLKARPGVSAAGDEAAAMG